MTCRPMLCAALALLLTLPAAAGPPAQPLAAGQAAPDAALKDADGKDTTLHAALAGKPTVVIVYRGGW